MAIAVSLCAERKLHKAIEAGQQTDVDPILGEEIAAELRHRCVVQAQPLLDD